MKQKLILSLGIAVIMSITASAQLSTGINSSNNIRTGNRAEMGDFGLYLGAKTSIYKDLTEDFDLSGTLPLLNLKYMYDSDLEVRIGVEIYRAGKTLKGTIKDDAGKSDIKEKVVKSNYFIYPGLAYHFSKLNLLDVYAGAELPFGTSGNKSNSEEGKSYSKYKQTSYHIGLGGFVGLQAYIANLPIAIGFEYGLASMFDFGLKGKSEVKLPDQKATVSYVPDNEVFGDYPMGPYNTLSARQGRIGSQMRLTLTYFFKN